MKLFVENCWIINEQNDLRNLHMVDFEKLNLTNDPNEANIVIQCEFNDFRFHNGKKILINMEPWTLKNFENYDIIISTHLEHTNLNKVIYYPFAFFYINSFKRIDYILNRNLYFDFNNKKKFCLFVASNEKAWQRIDFFKRLSKYKNVDSRGKVLPNFDIISSKYWTDDFLNIIREYKFIICFENSDIKGYGTEKIINAYLGDTIPIYWGNKNFYEFLNKKSMIILENYNEENINKAITEIIELDNNNDLYFQKIKEPLFLNNKIPEEFIIDNIRKKLSNML